MDEIDAGVYCAAVEGSDMYEVHVALKDQNEILSIECDCPYDWDAHCKHQAAVLFALREQLQQGDKTASDTPPLMVRVKTALEGQTREALVETLLALVRETPALGNRLIYEMADKGDAQALVDAMWEAIRHAQRASERRVHACAKEVERCVDDMLEAAREVESAHDAVMFLLTVISGCGAMNDVVFDEDNEFSWRAETAIDALDELVADAVYEGTASQQEALFEAVFEGAQMPSLRDWDDQLVECVMPLCVLPTCREKVDAYWEKRLRVYDGQQDHYMVKYIKLRQFSLIEKFDDEQSAERFIRDNLLYNNFREMAIAAAMKKQDYQAVLTLSLAGARADVQSPGRLRQWQIYAFRAHKELGDTLEARGLAYQFLVGGDFDYYAWLKQSYPDTEWVGELKRLLVDLESKPYGSVIYEKVLIMEHLWDSLMAHIERIPSRVFSLHEYVAKHHPQRVDAAFHRAIIDMAERSTDRSAYRELCTRIQTYSAVCGQVSARKIVQQLRETYRRKPAMMDEMNKAFPA